MAKNKAISYARKQPKGSIMKPSTFKSIEKKAAAKGYDNPKAVAGAAYKKTAEAKYRKAKKK